MEFDRAVAARGGEIADGVCRDPYPGVSCRCMAAVGYRRPLPCLAVTEGIAPFQRVVSINRAARSQGVSRGMSKVQAEATGSLIFRNRSIAEETASFEGVLKIAERISPRIEALSGHSTATLRPIRYLSRS